MELQLFGKALTSLTSWPEGPRVPRTLKFVGYMYNYAHVIYNM